MVSGRAEQERYYKGAANETILEENLLLQLQQKMQLLQTIT